MLTSEAPIGEIINYIHKNQNSYADKALIKKIEALVDLIIIRTNKKGVNDSLESLLDDLFKLRFTILNNAELVAKIFKGLNNSIENRIELQFNKSTKHPELELAFVNAINIYRKIASSTIDKISDEPFIDFSVLSSFKYEDAVTFLESLPGTEAQQILPYLKSSLMLDYAFIVSELIFDNELKLKKSEVEDLCSLLKNTTEEFAIYSNLFGLWHPNESDETQWMRNIKIRIGAFESMYASNTVSSEELNKFIAA